MFQSTPIPPMAQRAALLEAGEGRESPAWPGEAEAFPVEAVSRAMRRVLARRAREALQYGPAEGLEGLREWVCAHLAGQGLRLRPSQVLISSGSRHALDLLGKVLLDPASPLLVQRPTRLGALRAFRPYAARLVGLRCDEQGPVPEALADALPGARMAYLQTRFADPTGLAVPEARARQLADLLAGSGCWLVEDQTHGELWLDTPPAPGLLARGVEHGVLVGSFSPLVFPGLRLGWVAGHASLIARLAQARRAAELQPGSLSQWVLLEMLREGFVERHLPALRARCRERRDAVLEALRRHMPEGVAWTRPQGGAHLWLRLPDGVDAAELLAPAGREGLPLLPGRAFDAGAGGCASFGECSQCRFAEDPQGAAPMRHALRLSFAALAPRAAEPCVARLAQLLRGQAPAAWRPREPASARDAPRLSLVRPHPMRPA
jgi:2-aminoadipate transaminase